MDEDFDIDSIFSGEDDPLSNSQESELEQLLLGSQQLEPLSVMLERVDWIPPVGPCSGVSAVACDSGLHLVFGLATAGKAPPSNPKSLNLNPQPYQSKTLSPCIRSQAHIIRSYPHIAIVFKTTVYVACCGSRYFELSEAAGSLRGAALTCGVCCRSVCCLCSSCLHLSSFHPRLLVGPGSHPLRRAVLLWSMRLMWRPRCRLAAVVVPRSVLPMGKLEGAAAAGECLSARPLCHVGGSVMLHMQFVLGNGLRMTCILEMVAALILCCL
jgi:hypothetical protein